MRAAVQEYRGMGSMGAMRGYGRDRYATGQTRDDDSSSERCSSKLVPEGIEGRVATRGGWAMPSIDDGRPALRHGLCRHVQPRRLREGRFVRISPAGFVESHPLSIIITKEAPNYQVRRSQAAEQGVQRWGNLV